MFWHDKPVHLANATLLSGPCRFSPNSFRAYELKRLIMLEYMCTDIIAGLFDINARYLMLFLLVQTILQTYELSIKGTNHILWHLPMRPEFICVQKCSQKTNFIIQVKTIPHQTRMNGKSDYNLNAFSLQKNNVSVIQYPYFALMYTTRHVQRDWWVDTFLFSM